MIEGLWQPPYHYAFMTASNEGIEDQLCPKNRIRFLPVDAQRLESACRKATESMFYCMRAFTGMRTGQGAAHARSTFQKNAQVCFCQWSGRPELDE